MSRVYDSWERLVGAVLNREKLRQLALFESFDSFASSSHEYVSDVRPIEFKELKKATRNFRPGLTLDGELCRVFKGWIDEHSLTASKPGIGIPVAVKILNRDLEGLQGREEDDGFNELHYLSQHHHPNLIKLIGYCSKEANMLILVYEFMSKGSLDNLLFGSNFALGYVRPIKFKELKKATRNFRPGQTLDGGLGRVFKGWINEHSLTASKPGVGIPVAVKILNLDLEGLKRHEEDDGFNELHYLSQFHHPNLIKLIGYCSKEGNLLILVYEFISKGSLDNLFGSYSASGLNQSLSWETRIKVAIGAARALSFLHDLENPVIHRDFRMATILIDEEFNPKLSCFNLARDGEMTPVKARVSVGKHGYAAPEYMATGHLTAKCVVYSFGVFLLELLSWRRFIYGNRIHEKKNLADWAETYLRERKKIYQIMDSMLESHYTVYTHSQKYTLGTIALRCLSAEPEQRPRMAEVLVALEQLQKKTSSVSKYRSFWRKYTYSKILENE